MGDPISVAASVAGLISLGLQTTNYLVTYYAAYRNQDDNLARTADRLGDLLQSLYTVDNVAQTRKWRANEKTILQDFEKSIARCEDVIHELQAEVRKLQKEPVDTLIQTIRAAGRRAAYPFRQSTLKKLDEDIDDFRDNVFMALQALQLKEHQNTQDDIEEMKTILKTTQAQHLAISVHQWLKAPDATINYNAACAKRYAGTGLWFIRSAAFTAWLQQDNSFLWLYGFAGCGKSVLCSTIIQHAFRHQRSQTGSSIAFFFFTFNDESKQDASAMLRALLLQLSGQVIGIDADLTRLKDSYNHGTPPVSTLLEYLRQAITRSPHIYILLDALDECPAEDTRDDVLSAIQTMRQWSLPGLHLLVTSRDIVNIRQALNVQVQNTVGLKNDDISQDISRYVSHQVETDPALQRWGHHRETIKQHLAQHANGVFRWVECQLRPLRKCAKSVRHLRQCLESLPDSLDATYERMLCDIGKESREEAQRILTLLCFSSQPLSVAEVIDAIAVDLDDAQRYDYDRKLENSEDLLRICPGLIDILAKQRRGQNEENDDDDDDDVNYSDAMAANVEIVRIAHFSVQEYLLSDRIRHGRANFFALSNTTGHLQISNICLIYLSNEDFLTQTLTRNLINQYPLARFAAQYWYHHYKQNDMKRLTSLETWIRNILTVDSNFDRWIRLYDADNRSTRIYYDGQNKNHASPIYYASLLGLKNILQLILSGPGAEVNAEGGRYGNALQAALDAGHEKVVQMLLDAGAEGVEVSSKSSDEGSNVSASK